ncbi:MAG: tetratricopeptide repeat protein [Thermostichus sp. DG02_5_bins_236]
MATQPGTRSVEDLTKSLQKALAPLPSRSVLKQDVLYFMVEFPEEALFNRSMVLHRVASQLGGLPVQGLSQLVVYGRLKGEAQPKWKKVFYLTSGESSADATQIVLPGTQISEIKVLEAQKPVVDPDSNPDFHRSKTLEAPVPKTHKERRSEATPRPISSLPVAIVATPPPARILTPQPTPRPTAPTVKTPTPNFDRFALRQLLHNPQMRPVLAGGLALLLLLGGGLVVRALGTTDARARAGALGLGIPLLVLAAGGGWLGWKTLYSQPEIEEQDFFATGLSFLEGQQIPEAIAQFQEAVKEQPDHAPAHFELAKLLVSTDRLQEGLKHFQRAKRLNSKLKDIDIHLVETMKALAKQWLAQHQPDEVLAHLPEALPLTKGSAQAEIFSLIGQAWANKRDWAQALAQQQTALGLDPHSTEAHICIAQINIGLGRWDEAIDSCWAALELNDRLGEAHYVMGQALLRKGQLKAAVAAFRTALNLDLTPAMAAQVHVDLGIALVQAGQLAQASQEFSQVILADSQQGRAYYGLGLVLAAQEQYTEAVKNYRRALELDPTLHEATAAIGLAYLGHKQRDVSGRKFVRPEQVLEAMQQFEQALKQDPDLPEAHFGVGEVLRIKSDLNGAEASYQQAIRGNSSYGLAHYRLGSVFARKGKLEQAIEQFRLALEIYPNFPEAKGSLQRLLSKQSEEVHTDLLPL